MDIEIIERKRYSGTSGRRPEITNYWVWKKNGCRYWKHSLDEKKISFKIFGTDSSADGAAIKYEKYPAHQRRD